MLPTERHDLPEGTFMFSVSHPFCYSALLRFVDALSCMDSGVVKKVIISLETGRVSPGEIAVLDVAVARLSRLDRPVMLVTSCLVNAEHLMQVPSIKAGKTVLFVGGSET